MTISTTYGASMPICPSSPNCVSSEAQDSHRIEPFVVQGDPDAAFQRLQTLLAQRSDATVVSVDKDVIRVEFRTLMGFVDDGLFLLDRSIPAICVRSAARSGYWDLGKNRRRLEEIRQQFTPTGATP